MEKMYDITFNDEEFLGYNGSSYGAADCRNEDCDDGDCHDCY